MSVHLCIECCLSLAHPLVVHTECWNSNYVRLSRAQLQLSQYLLMINTRRFLIYISLWWWMALPLDRKFSFPRGLHSLCPLLWQTSQALHMSFLEAQFKFAHQRWRQICHIPRRCFAPLLFHIGLTVLSLDHHHWTCGEVARKSAIANYPERVRQNRIRAVNTSCMSCQWLTDSNNNLPRGEDVKKLLMLRWENCMHRWFQPN